MSTRTGFAKICALALILTGTSSPAGGQVADNDSCQRTLVVDNPYGLPVIINYNNDFATTGPENQHNSACNYAGTPGIQNDQWYSWIATGTGMATLTACGAVGADSKVAVFYSESATARCPIDTDIIACNDDACGLRSEITFYVAAGNRYTFQVGKFPGSPNGAGFFTLTPPYTHGSDDCGSPTVVAGSPVGLTFNNASATTGTVGQHEPACDFFGRTGIENDEWFLWTSPGEGTATITGCTGLGGASGDTKVAVYASTQCPGRFNQAIACNDDACGTVSALSFAAACGQQFLIQIGKYPGSPNGTGTLEVSLAPSQPGCVCPRTFTGNSAMLPFNFASHFPTENIYPADLCNDPFGARYPTWYRWVAVGNGAATVFGCGLGNTSDTKVSVYRGCPPTLQNAVGCSDDSCGLQPELSFLFSDGVEYLIQIGTGTRISVYGAGTLAFIATVFPPPANDACGSPTPISGSGMVPFDTRIASNDGGPWCGDISESIPDVWFRYTSTAQANVTFSTCIGTPFNTVLAAYASCNGTLLGCSDDSCGAQSRLTVPVAPNSPILVRVGGAVGTLETGMLTFESTLGPPNDPCENATPISQATSPVPFSTVQATNEADNSVGACGSSQNTRDVWFLYLAPRNGIVTLSTCTTTDYDSVVEVYSGCLRSGGQRLYCSDDSCSEHNEILTVPVIAHQYYKIRVAGYAGDFGSGSLSVIDPPAIVDTCASAVPISNAGTVSFDTRQTTDFTASSCGGASPAVWYRYQSSTTGMARFATCGTIFDTTLSALSVCGGSELACSDDPEYCFGEPRAASMLVPVTANVPIYVRLGGHYGLTGTGTLSYSTAVVPNDSCADAMPISGTGSVSFDAIHASPDGALACPGSADGPDVWFVYTSPTAGIATFEACSTPQSAPAHVSVYDSCLGARIACGSTDIACGNGGTRADIIAQPGVPVWIRVAGPGAQPAEGTLLYTAPPPPSFPPADWNHDGQVNSQDFFDFLGAFFASNADFNHDGVTNSQDFFDFMNCFFGGC